MTLSTDEHKVYPIALADVKGLEEDREAETFIHKQYSSKAERTLRAPCSRSTRRWPRQGHGYLQKGITCFLATFPLNAALHEPYGLAQL
ncbi:hypothetical protein MASR2M78_16680 [Treponema sp.]